MMVTGLFIIITFAIIIGLTHTFLMSRFKAIESENTQKNMQQIQEAFQSRIESLNRLDWASWDDTYNFVRDCNEAFIEANLYDESFATLKLNILLFIDTSGQLVYGKEFDLQSLEEKSVPQDLIGYLSRNNVLWNHSDITSIVSGVILLDKNPLLISSKPILTSLGEGPIRGALLVDATLTLRN